MAFYIFHTNPAFDLTLEPRADLRHNMAWYEAF